ncbi:hypothetical protein DVK01_12040 [Haloarcula sp. Atlit-120R]|nr:hypothetical protein DVK01_12040 [Haloarcula sp. Atlit-120R]
MAFPIDFWGVFAGRDRCVTCTDHTARELLTQSRPLFLGVVVAGCSKDIVGSAFAARIEVVVVLDGRR